MKTSVIVLFVSCFSFSLTASDDKFVEVMQKNIRLVYEAKSVEELTQAVNAFERIANSEKTRWEPFYYQAFGNIMLSNHEADKGKKDQFLDQALAILAKASSLKANDSEIVALEGFVLMMKLSVDPQSRGPVYAPRATATFEKAKVLNPGNPRALALLAQMQFGSAQFFGSSTAEACSTNSEALNKFDAYKPENPLSPQWGRAMVESMAEKCK